MPSSEEKRIPLLRSHPLAIATTCIVMLFLIGSIVVARKEHLVQAGGVQTWSGDAAPLQNPSALTPVYPSGTDATPIADTSDALFGSLYNLSSNTSAPPSSAANDPAFSSFMHSFLNTAPSGTNENTGQAAIQSSSLYTPTGLISTTSGKVRTPTQESLYTYGNAAGSLIKSFENNHSDQQDVLAAQAKDRNDPEKAQALRDLAGDMKAIGTGLLALRNVPAAAQSANTDLGQSYQTIGQLLAQVANGGDDKQFLAEITAYDAGATTFIHNYLALTGVFSISGVSFSATDGGSVFMFSGTGSL